MQANSGSQPDNCSERCQHDIFPEHIGCCLLWSETKYLDRCNLPDSLGDVDVRQVINYDKCQRTGAEDDQKHHCIQTAHHFVDLAEHIRIDRNRRNDVACQQLFRQFPVLLCTLRCMDINALVNRITSVIEFPCFRRNINVIINIVSRQSSHLHF